MPPLVASISTVIAFLTILSQIFVLLALIFFIFRKSAPAKKFFGFFSGKTMPLAFLVVLAGMALSLFYSDYANYDACKLCWYQRIFFYPNVFLLGWAMFKNRASRDSAIHSERLAEYILLLSVVGILIAADHVYLQAGGNSLIPCGADGVSSCGQRYVWEFGYIGIPMMSFTGFAVLIVLMSIQKFWKK